MDDAMMKKGAREPLRALVAQAKVTLGLAKKAEYVAPLAGAGWEAAETTSLEQLLGDVDTKEALALDARGTARRATQTEAAARRAAKLLVRRERNARPSALERARKANLAVDEKALRSGELGDSTPDLVEHLRKLEQEVKRLDEHYKPYNKKQSLYAQLVAARQALETADQTQETSHQTAPVETKTLNEKKGRLLSKLEELNRLAKNAFEGQAEIVGLFNKDLLLRGRLEAEAEAGVARPTEPTKA